MKILPSIQSLDILPRPRVAFFDLDGTVVNAAGEITERVRTRIQQLQSAGVVIAVASGRPWFGARSVIEAIGAKGASLFFSGALIGDPVTGRAIKSENISYSCATEIVQQCRAKSLYFEWYTAQEYFTETSSLLAEIHAEYLGHAPAVRPFPDEEDAGQILKVLMMTENAEQEELAREIANGMPQVTLGAAPGAAHPGILFVNLTSRDAERGRAFEWLLKHYGVSASEVISIGDAESDLPFLERAGWSIAMGSAPINVKNAARFVTGTVANDGAAEALEAILEALRSARS